MFTVRSAGNLVGVGVGVLVAEGLGVGVTVCVGVGVGVPAGDPVQGVPSSAKEVGTGLEPLWLPLKPSSTVAPVPSEPLYDAFLADTAAPAWVTVAFQAWLTV